METPTFFEMADEIHYPSIDVFLFVRKKELPEMV